MRTVARSAARYNPISYHNGSVWPHDNAVIALGFARYGLKAGVLRIFKGLFQAASYMDLRRLPELFCGFAWRQLTAPTLYPVACSPQAWASATVFALMQASLGLSFDQGGDEIRFDQPMLPDFLDELHLRGLQARHGVGRYVVAALRRRSVGRHHAAGKARCRSSSSVDAPPSRQKPTFRAGDGCRRNKPGFRGLHPERMLHAAHASVGSVEDRTPSRRLRQGAEQALVEEIVGAVGLAAEGGPVPPRGGQDDAIGLGHFSGRKAAAVARRDDDDRGHGGASARQRPGELVGAERPVRAGEPQTGAALAVRGQKDQASVARPRRQVGDAAQQNIGKGRLGAGAELGGTGAEPVDIVRRNTRRERGAGSFRGSRCRTPVRCRRRRQAPPANSPAGRPRRRRRHRVDEDDAQRTAKAKRRYKPHCHPSRFSARKHSRHGAASRAILAEIEEITACQ